MNVIRNQGKAYFLQKEKVVLYSFSIFKKMGQVTNYSAFKTSLKNKGNLENTDMFPIQIEK